MNDPAVKRGGFVGAGIIFLIVLSTALVSLVHRDVSTSAPSPVFDWFLVFYAIFSFLLGILGYFTGKMGAKCLNSYLAFLYGGMLFGAIFFLTTSLTFILNKAFSARLWIFIIPALVILSCCGALICGVGSIVARDYRRFQKMRIFPQYTLQELFIVLLLMAIVFSAIASLRFIVGR